MDKFVRTVLAIIGAVFEIIAFAICYILGLVWVLYLAIRKRNYKKVFTKLNKGAAKEFKSIISVITE